MLNLQAGPDGRAKCLILASVSIYFIAVFGVPFYTAELFEFAGIQIDWPQTFMMRESLRKVVVEQETFPFWNPYFFGGTPAIGHPESEVLSPWILLVYFFGTIRGSILILYSFFLIGSLGYYNWLRNRQLSIWASLLAGILVVVVLGVVGKTGARGYGAVLLFPWIALTWERSFIDSKQILITGGVLALVYLHSGVPYVFLSFLAYLVWDTVARCWVDRSTSAIKNLAFGISGCIGLAAIRMLPTAHALGVMPRTWPKQAQDIVDFTKTGLTLELILKQLSSYSDTIIHHYHYEAIGLLSFLGGGMSLILCMGMFSRRVANRERWLLILLFWITLGANAPIYLWGILTQLPIIESLVAPQKFWFIFLAIAPLFLAAGFDKLLLVSKSFGFVNQRKLKYLAMLATAAWFTFYTVQSRTELKTAQNNAQNSESEWHNDVEWRFRYYNALRNDQPVYSGNDGFFEWAFAEKRLDRTRGAKTERLTARSADQFKVDRSLAFGLNPALIVVGDGFKVNLLSHSNASTLHLRCDCEQAVGTGQLTVNMQAFTGWELRGEENLKLDPTSDLLRMSLKPGTYTWSVDYRPHQFLLACLLSLLTLVVVIIIWRRGGCSPLGFFFLLSLGVITTVCCAQTMFIRPSKAPWTDAARLFRPARESSNNPHPEGARSLRAVHREKHERENGD